MSYPSKEASEEDEYDHRLAGASSLPTPHLLCAKESFQGRGTTKKLKKVKKKQLRKSLQVQTNDDRLYDENNKQRCKLFLPITLFSCHSQLDLHGFPLAPVCWYLFHLIYLPCSDDKTLLLC